MDATPREIDANRSKSPDDRESDPASPFGAAEGYAVRGKGRILGEIVFRERMPADGKTETFPHQNRGSKIVGVFTGLGFRYADDERKKVEAPLSLRLDCEEVPEFWAEISLPLKQLENLTSGLRVDIDDDDDQDDPPRIQCWACKSKKAYGRCYKCKNHVCSDCSFIEPRLVVDGSLLLEWEASRRICKKCRK
jgi:hypothetical protein